MTDAFEVGYLFIAVPRRAFVYASRGGEVLAWEAREAVVLRDLARRAA